MKCPECIESGQKSKTYQGTSMTTVMGTQRYWDEQGDLHNHDPNITSTSFSCSNGHSWVTKHKKKCITCDREPPLGLDFGGLL